MIFFWWPISVTPSLWMSLNEDKIKKKVKEIFQVLNKHLSWWWWLAKENQVCRNVSKVKVIVCQLYFYYKQFDYDPDGSKF